MIEVAANTRNLEVMTATRQMDGGYLRVYGAPRPASPEIAVGAQVLFAECRFSSPSFGNPTNGAATAKSIAPETNVRATGVPVWFRVFAQDGTTAVLDGDMFSDLVPDQGQLVQGGSFSVLSLQYSRT